MADRLHDSDQDTSPGRDARRIVVVGPCAAGKSTLVTALRLFGYDARVSGQEHSEISSLWRHSNPDVLIALEVNIAAVRRRRSAQWPEWLLQRQIERLRDAEAVADLTIDTSRLDQRAVFEKVVAFLEASAPA